MAAHSRPSKIINPNEAVFSPVQNSDPVGSFASEPFTLPKSPFNPRIRPFDGFCFTLHRLSDTIRSATNFFFARADSFDNSLKRERKSGGCAVVPDLSRSESAVTQQNVRKSFRIRTYDKPQGGGVSFNRTFRAVQYSESEGRDYKQATAESAVQPAIFAV